MATQFLIRRHVASIATGALMAGITLYPTNTLHAESPQEANSRKPIYDDAPAQSMTSVTSSIERRETTPGLRSQSVTDLLAKKVGVARLFLYSHVARMEDKVNDFMDSAFELEDNFTSTISSLVPAPHTGERIMPGLLYVVVAAMAGSIVSRNRNIVLRATLPLAIGLTAGWALLPNSLQNISNLAWKYEQKFPVIAESHIRSREAVEKTWMIARARSQQASDIVNEGVSATRNAVEGWVKKGK
ncbi:BgTH12-05962 [Blumeria graminis f. sp. triticale]|uniref:MICOS complex subunit n=3 Tax=Blumeria graminis TaxID=34373 RepID=A0A9X9QEI8_BLUGR|nr:hypothetical protein BGT96224_1888 [Blumeria graminis f. sp. tritici 96224]CAD6504229.1 BgTH12-05962 [Blumeria graminis f. sp. triticale]VDB91045.1 Bgt-1888 [Blumeria graminis f. sp. tritici]